MRFAKWVFLAAGIYGATIIAPQYFLEAKYSADYPPAITHPEFYYGFLGLCLAWQLMFIVIGLDPARYRLAMLPAILEKAGFALAMPVLYHAGRVPSVMLAAAALDAVWGVLFGVAYRRTRHMRQ